MKKNLNKISIAILSLLPAGVLAYDAPVVSIKESDKTDVAAIIGKVIDWILLLVGAITVLFIIYAGIMYVTSSGNKDQIERAKQTLTYAVIGLVVIILAGVIVNLVIGLPTSVGLTK